MLLSAKQSTSLKACLSRQAPQDFGERRNQTQGQVAPNVSIKVDVNLTKGFLIHALAPRELAVLQLMSQGLSNSAIAKRLVINRKTVENYINHIYQALQLVHEKGLCSRVLAVLDYLDYTDRYRTDSDKPSPEHTDLNPLPIINRFAA